MRSEDTDTSQQVRLVANRAIRRLDLLETVVLVVAAGLALLAGALAALILEASLALPFRPTWMVASVALFVVPAAVAYLRERRLRRRTTASTERGEGPDRDGR